MYFNPNRLHVSARKNLGRIFLLERKKLRATETGICIMLILSSCWDWALSLWTVKKVWNKTFGETLNIKMINWCWGRNIRKEKCN